MKGKTPCIPCLVRRASREGHVVVERTAPGFAGGSWGSARQGEMVTMPPEVFDRNRADYRLVDVEQLLRDDVAREAREDLDRIERDDDPDGVMDSLLL